MSICETELKKASRVCPDNVRPLASVIVPDIITGIRLPFSSISLLIPNKAALALSVSKIVSTNSISTPPSISAKACS